MPTLARITVYPVKALEGTDVETVEITPGGSLRSDRRFAICDAEGKIVNGKRLAEIHQIRSTYNLSTGEIALGTSAESGRFQIQRERSSVEALLTRHFGFPVYLVEDEAVGFPDDLDAPGPTLVGAASLEAVSGWYRELSPAEAHVRFRANLVIAGTPPFWEDQLVGVVDHPVRFRIGSVELWGVNPCQRCVVPTRNPLTGDVNHGFSQTFRQNREEQLPEWAPRERFNHYYRFAVNTRIAASEAGKRLAIGDEVTIL